MKTLPSWLVLILFIVICLGAGGLGSVATASEISGWYQTLRKPDWTPPNSWFGPVWTTLYVLMAIAAWLVWRRGGFVINQTAFFLFFLQLALNTAWSFIFFGVHQPGWAFAELIVLWATIAATLVTFYRRSTWAGLLLVPYLAWVSFAGVLNFAIWRLNA